MNKWIGKWKTNDGDLTLEWDAIHGNNYIKVKYKDYEGIGFIQMTPSRLGETLTGKIFYPSQARQKKVYRYFELHITTGQDRFFQGGWSETKITPSHRSDSYPNKWHGTKPITIDGVFEGGGTLGSAYVGSLQALQDNSIWFNTVVGNSAGAITAALIAAGYNTEEMHWLTAAYKKSPSEQPKTLKQLGINEPIDFSEFLDAPSSDQSDLRIGVKEKTLLWKSLHLDFIDIPSEAEIANKIYKPFIIFFVIKKRITNPTYGWDYETNPSVYDQVLEDFKVEESLVLDTISSIFNKGDNYASETWDKVYKESDKYRKIVNLLYDHGIYKGEVFFKKIDFLLKKKNNGKEVLFENLKIPLAVIATDITEGKMIVYSSKLTPKFPVAEAVRRSMSVPLFFEPRFDKVKDENGDPIIQEIVDGGVASNYPVWIYLDREEKYFDRNITDEKRIKIGFSVDDNKDALDIWPHLNKVTEVSSLSIIKKLLGSNEPSTSSSNSSIEKFIKAEGEALEAKFKYIFNLLNASDKKEAYINEATIRYLNTNGNKFYNVDIPVKKFNWLDFDMNLDKHKLDGILQRGWYSTIDVLKENKLFIRQNNLDEGGKEKYCPFQKEPLTPEEIQKLTREATEMAEEAAKRAEEAIEKLRDMSWP